MCEEETNTRAYGRGMEYVGRPLKCLELLLSPLVSASGEYGGPSVYGRESQVRGSTTAGREPVPGL